MLDVQTLAPRAAALTDDIAHVWVYSFDPVRHRLAELREHLSGDECKRADRFYFARDRERFVCWRGVLRELLGQYTACPPGAILFSYGESGKPMVATVPGSIHFSVSHSGDLALFAFSRTRALGVDIERVEEDLDFLGIALEYLSAAERRLLDRLDARDRLVEFYRCWTRREAYLKGIGSGLSGLTQTLEVYEGNNQPRNSAADEWCVQTLEVAPDYCASLAVQGGPGWSLALQALGPDESL